MNELLELRDALERLSYRHEAFKESAASVLGLCQAEKECLTEKLERAEARIAELEENQREWGTHCSDYVKPTASDSE